MIFVYRTSMVGPSGIPLSDYAEGDIIKLNEGGSPVEFYVAKHDYESGLNGAGRTLVVRKEIINYIPSYEEMFDSDIINAYATSDIDSYFNGTYKNLLDPVIQTAIGATKFYYTPGNGNNTVGILERPVFALSMTELGKTYPYSINVEGSILPSSATILIALKDGSPYEYWTRTPIIQNNIAACTINRDGSFSAPNCNSQNGYRPCFTLPSTLLFNPDTNEVVV